MEIQQINELTQNLTRSKQVQGINNPYKQFDFTIADGAIETLFYDLNYFRVLSISTTTGVTVRFGSSGTPTDIVDAGIGYEIPNIVNRVQIFNNSGGVLTISVAVAIGKIYDDRLNISGSIKVINDTGTELKTNPAGSTGSYGQVTVNATADLVAASAVDTKSVLIQNQGTTDCYIGFDSSVSSSNGMLLAAGASMGLEYSGDIYAETASGSTTVSRLTITV